MGFRGPHRQLSLDLPPEARGRDLSADEMDFFGARLDDYFVERRDRAGDVTRDGASGGAGDHAKDR